MLYYLIYMSRASKHIGESELESLLAKSVKNNQDLGVTGMLLHINEQNALNLHGLFIQVLEGPQDVVKALYDKISKDARHTHIVTLFSYQLEKRNFPDWSMGFKRIDSEALPAELKGWFDPDTFPEPMNKDRMNIPLTYLQSFYNMHK